MENGNAQLAANSKIVKFDDSDELVGQRLNVLLEANAEIARGKSTNVSEREQLEAALMKNPISASKAFAHFGLLLGTFTPAALILRFFIESRFFQPEDIWLLGILAIVNLISAIVGYTSGGYIGKLVQELEKESWSKMLLTLPFIGIFWGMIAGGAGGFIIFGIGAFFGALIGSLTGAAALPFFSVFHRCLKSGDKIENKHFLPLSVGTTATIAAFILGL